MATADTAGLKIRLDQRRELRHEPSKASPADASVAAAPAILPTRPLLPMRPERAATTPLRIRLCWRRARRRCCWWHCATPVCSMLKQSCH